MTVSHRITVNGTTLDFIQSSMLRRSIGENNSTSRLNLVLQNIKGVSKNKICESDEIILFSDDSEPATTRLFTGTVAQIKFEGKGSVREKMKILVRDYGALLQKSTVEPEVYTNQEISFIVNDIMTKYGSSSITTNNVNVTGTVLSRIVFKQVNVFDAIKQLAELANFTFYIDADKDLHFEQKNTVSSGVTLDNTNVVKSRFRNDVDSVRNRVFVYGARQLIHAPQESFIADGVGSVFTLIESPHNTAVDVNEVDQKGDVFFVNESPTSGADYLVNFQDKQIIFVSGTAVGYNSIPGSLGSVVVNYEASRPIIKLAEDQSSIAKHDSRTAIIIDNNIEDATTAKDVARNQLELLRDPKIQGDLTLQSVINLTPSQTVVVNMPNERQANKTYEIIESSYDFTPKKTQWDMVLKVKVSQRISDVTDILKEIILAQKRLEAGDIDDKEVISRLQLATGSFSIAMRVSAVRTQNIGNSLILGHPVNGQLGEPEIGVGGGQVVLGNSSFGAVTPVYVNSSGNLFREFVRNERFIDEDATNATVDLVNHKVEF